MSGNTLELNFMVLTVNMWVFRCHEWEARGSCERHIWWQVKVPLSDFSWIWPLSFISVHIHQVEFRSQLCPRLKPPVALWDGWGDVRAALIKLYSRRPRETLNVTSHFNLIILILILTIRAFYEPVVRLFRLPSCERPRSSTHGCWHLSVRRIPGGVWRPHFLWQNTHTSCQSQRENLWRNCVSWGL